MSGAGAFGAKRSTPIKIRIMQTPTANVISFVSGTLRIVESK